MGEQGSQKGSRKTTVITRKEKGETEQRKS
jgi:hypothetical protein